MNKPEDVRRTRLANVKISIDRVFRIFGLDEPVGDISEFEVRMEEIVARYYPELTDLAYQVLQMSKSLPRYPDHEELFLIMDVFANNVQQIEESYAAMMEKKDETLAEHVNRMGDVLQEATEAEREFRQSATLSQADRMGIAIRQKVEVHEEACQTEPSNVENELRA